MEKLVAQIDPTPQATLFPHLYPNNYKYPWTDKPDKEAKANLLHSDNLLILGGLILIISLISNL